MDSLSLREQLDLVIRGIYLSSFTDVMQFGKVKINNIKPTIDEILKIVRNSVPKKMEFVDSKNGCGCGICQQIEIFNQAIEGFLKILE